MASLGSDTKYRGSSPVPTSSGIALGWAHVGDWLGLARSSRRDRAPTRTQDRISHMSAFRGEYWRTNPQSSDIERYAWAGGR
jgi:hypothetical protein